jgi:hypothetical protein
MRNNPTPTSQTNITAQHREAFHALTCGEYRNFALFSCFVDGEQAAAIVAVNVDGEIYHLQPLFVSVTEKMTLADHEGRFPLVRHAPETPQPAAPTGASDIATTAEKE